MKTLKRILLLILMLTLGQKTGKAQCAASFVYNNGLNGAVSFTSTSVLANSITNVYTWNYGAGGPTFTATGTGGIFTNTTYTANGTYVVTLFISSASPSCASTFTAVVTVTNVTCPLVPNFTFTQGANGLVNFSNTSIGTYSGTTYVWNFGNGNTSTLSAPAFNYTANGSYTVSLLANNNFTPSCLGTHTAVVVVNSICNLSANFTGVGLVNGQVQFTNLTTPTTAVSYNWNFGNATTSNSMNPLVTYTANGNYTVTLVATSVSPPCTSSISSVVSVTNVVTCSLQASFSAIQGTNGSVSFTNTSTGTTGATTYSWNFGNAQTSSSVNPSVTYTNNGNYIVSLTANNNTTIPCSSTSTLNLLINNVCNLVPAFNFSIGNNGSVNFVNASTGTQSVSTYVYNFGHSSLNNPSTAITPNAFHVFPNGTYIVTLTVTNFSLCSGTYTQLITIANNNCFHTANFTHTVSNNGQVLFTSASTGTNGSTTYTWNFGDGNTSNLLNPGHTYVNAGTHYVSLSIRDTSFIPCTSNYTQAINITGIPCSANAGFSLVPTATAQYWNAIPVYPFNVSNAVWSWGDGSSSTGLYSTHQYSASGMYSICLSVTVSCGASASSCGTYSVYKASSGIINVNVVNPPLYNEVLGLQALGMDEVSFVVYPNPSNGEVFFKLSQGSGVVRIQDLMGRVIRELPVSADSEQILVADLKEYPSGVYFAEFSTREGKQIRKIILSNNK